MALPSDYADGVRFRGPKGIALLGRELYVADMGNDVIRSVDIESGEVRTLAGSGDSGCVNGGPEQARFDGPSGLAVRGGCDQLGSAGHLYVADQFNHSIRSVNLETGKVETIAGTGEAGHADMLALESQFNHPSALAIWGSNLYIADRDNFMIRCLNLDAGTVSTVAGCGQEGTKDGPLRQATFKNPMGLAVSMDTSELYVSDSDAHIIRCVNLHHERVTTLAGTGQPGCLDGPAIEARFDSPLGLACIPTGPQKTLYISDRFSHKIRAIEINRRSGRSVSEEQPVQVSTVVGRGFEAYADGSREDAMLDCPSGIVLHDSTIFFADMYNHCIRRIDLHTGLVGTIAGGVSEQ